MAYEQSKERGTDHVLEQLEKNQFFQGKLMTARDMQTEQDYHANRLHVINRFATGAGILYGAEVSSVEEANTELRVTIEPGVVIDRYGRPIVIEHTTTKTLPTPSEDVIYLYLRFEETELETVPVPKVRGAGTEEYMTNRIVEGFELTYQEVEPEDEESFPTVDTSIDWDSDTESVARSLANKYHQQNRLEVEPVEDPSILLGSFERTNDGSWIRGAETVRRNLVIDNGMLYSLLVSHITETDRPHDISGGPGEVPSDVEELVEMSEQFEELGSRIDTLNQYVMRKTLKDEIRFFTDIADRFEDHDAEASRLANSIVEKAEDAVREEVYTEPKEYRTRAGQKLQDHLGLGEVLESSATEETLEQYVKAVSELQTALAEDADITRIAEAQDGVCEAADSLEELYDVTKD
jgi:hypothetical protein